MHNQTATFKQNVLTAICNGAKIYKDFFLDYEYQVYSKSFTKNFYIISATKSNLKKKEIEFVDFLYKK